MRQIRSGVGLLAATQKLLGDAVDSLRVWRSSIWIPGRYIRLLESASPTEDDFKPAPLPAGIKLTWWQRLQREFGVSTYTSLDVAREVAAGMNAAGTRRITHYAVVDLKKLARAEVGSLRTGTRETHHDLIGRPARILAAVAVVRELGLP